MPVNLNLISQLILFAGTLWLGGYLLGLPSDKPSLKLTGLGALTYGLILSIRLFADGVNPGWWILPALFWLGAALYIWPSDARWRAAAITSWQLAAIPMLIMALLEPWLAAGPLLALLIVTFLLIRRLSSADISKALPLIALVSLFLTLSSGLLLLPSAWINSTWALSLLGLDLILMAVALVWWDALRQGHQIKEPLLRSFVSSMYLAAALAALVVIAIVLDGSMSPGKWFLLVSLVALGVLLPVFSNQIRHLLDRHVFNRNPKLSNERQLLLSAADNLPRLGSAENLEFEESEFVDLTRQALRDLSDLSRLTASPLTKLPLVVEQAGDNPLERAHHLRALLIDSVEKLKPRTEESFGVTDNWRYYNALYFPYVVGVSPYSRPTSPEHLSQATRQALKWFRREVPERTLYNWQATAAELVAQDLRSRLRDYSGWQ